MLASKLLKRGSTNTGGNPAGGSASNQGPHQPDAKKPRLDGGGSQQTANGTGLTQLKLNTESRQASRSRSPRSPRPSTEKLIERLSRSNSAASLGGGGRNREKIVHPSGTTAVSTSTVQPAGGSSSSRETERPMASSSAVASTSSAQEKVEKLINSAKPGKPGGLYDFLPPPDKQKDDEAAKVKKEQHLYADGGRRKSGDCNKVVDDEFRGLQRPRSSIHHVTQNKFRTGFGGGKKMI